MRSTIISSIVLLLSVVGANAANSYLLQSNDPTYQFAASSVSKNFPGFNGAIEILDFNFDLAVPVASTAGGGSGVGKANGGPLTITKNLDVNSPTLISKSFTGQAISGLSIIVLSSNGGKPVTTAIYRFGRVFLTDYSAKSDLTEGIAFAYGAIIEIVYVPGNPGAAPSYVGWDFTKNAAISGTAISGATANE